MPPAVTSSLIGLTDIILEWEEPFTWSDFDILQYMVSEVIDGVVNATFNLTDMAHVYSSPTGEMAESCLPLEFLVEAVNDVGVGEPGVVIDGLPIGQLALNPVEVQS